MWAKKNNKAEVKAWEKREIRKIENPNDEYKKKQTLQRVICVIEEKAIHALRSDWKIITKQLKKRERSKNIKIKKTQFVKGKKKLIL